MKICVQTSPILDKFGIDEGFRMISEAGFDGVDFNIDHTLSYNDIVHGVKVDLFDDGGEELLRLAQPYIDAAKKYGVAFHQMHAPFPTYVKNDIGNDIVMRSIKACFRVAGVIGCKYVIVHPNFLGYEDKLSPEDEWTVNIERYSEMIPAAKENDVIICLENMFTGHAGKIYAACCADMAEANRYIDALNEIAGEKRFGFCLDVGHSLLVGKEIYSTIFEIAPNLVALHVHDNNGISDQHLFPYMGVQDWVRFTDGLRDVKYSGAISFETFNGINVIDDELAADALVFLGKIGRMFAKRCQAN